MKKTLIALLAGLAFSFSALAAVNINTATQQELESLEGIGPVKAQAIVDYRKKNGNFKSVDDLEKVDGVGAVTLQSLRKEVTLTGKTTVVAPAAKDSSLVKAAESKTGDAKTKAKKEPKTKESKAEKSKDAKAVKDTSLVKAAEAQTKEDKPAKAKKAPKAKKDATAKAE